MIETLEGTEPCLITRRIVPKGEANIFDSFPRQIRNTIREVHYVDGSRRENKGKQGTYGIDLPPNIIEQVKSATNLIDIVKPNDHGMGMIPELDVESLVSSNDLKRVVQARQLSPVGALSPRKHLPGPTLDQGQEGSCVGHGCRHFVNGEPVMTDPRVGPTAVELYKYAQKIDPWPGEDYSGTSVTAGLETLVHYGYIKSVGYTRDLATFLRWLSEQGGLIIGADWYEGMHRTNAEGYITPTGRKTGGHCVWINELISGLMDVGGQNSWGAGWGINGGFFKLSVSSLRFLMESPSFVAGAVTQVGELSPPKPSPTDAEFDLWITNFCNTSTPTLLGKKGRIRSKHGGGWDMIPFK